ncbi:DNA primase small subunit domain-containing protein [Paenibacillus sp. BK720]|uniref:DNA primase small subunit domain-containing protein n=1 Tax=Paenibacillus sp. BK720 TaxID=2587092 RepID=UPI0014242006|nr:DNA primase small subunit domain-containing protein [Paenibacillus sp. BK720]NIK67906.1 hypothetical protein [Paenibacillus sp. BK720]
MAKEPQMQDFKYVDAWHTNENGQAVGWTRVEYPEGVLKYQQETANNFNCFCTVQRFASKTKGAKGEVFIAPLYFDLDYKTDPAVSQADAVKLIDFFMDDLKVAETDISLYFSGSKGFHILIDYHALGIKPGADLHKIYKHIAGYLIHRLELRALDLAVYTHHRMLRLPNSQHSGTKKFKIELTLEELRTLTLEEIKNKASMPRLQPVIAPEDRVRARGLRTEAGDFYQSKADEWREAQATSSARYEKEEFNFRKDRPPVCVQDILDGGWKKEGDRNQATVQLAAYYKEAGHPKEEAVRSLVDWVTRHTSADSRYDIGQRVANTKSVVEAVYDKDNNYRFGCAFIRSLHGEKRPGSTEYERVACAGSLCPCIKKGHQDEETATTLHLSQTGDAELTGKLVKTRVMVAGMKHTPYIVPSKIEYYCWGREGCKKTHCPLYDIPSHTYFRDLGVMDRELIQMTATNDDNITGILRTLSGIPSCTKYNTDVIETTNVDELLVIPMAEQGDESEEKANGYVLRKVYAVGGLPVTENKYYELSGYVFAHPKTMEATIMIKNAKPLQDVVDSFKLDEPVKEQLAALQPADYSVEAIEEKLAALCNDLTYNVTKIVERDETLLAVLLTYHSVLRFSVPWASDPIRGWLELKILGDTATGKSEIVSKVMNYVGLGNRVNAESTSRTGLTYKMEQAGSGGGAWYIVWGAWPRSDKEMLWIDEDTGIEKDAYGEMTLARSDGRLEVKRAVTAETPCRVRAILSGNPVKGRRLSEYGQGVAALRDIFNNEDIRRFDFALFMKSSDVPTEKYSGHMPTFPKLINSETLKNSILFSWSRKPEHVLFTAEAIDKILEVSKELSRVYGNATDVPLVSPSDQRNKVARLAVALASLTHSVDESGERIQVWPGHVEFIGAYLRELYNAPGCGLNYYARLAVREDDITDERYHKITEVLRKLETLKSDTKFFAFVKLFAQQNYVRQASIENMMAIEREEAKSIAATLTKMQMIQETSGGYRKTAKFNGYIGKLFEHGVFDSLEHEDDVI